MKRNFLLVPIFLMTACLSGCSPQLTAETFTHEAGEELSTDVTEYATFKKPEKAAEATLDLSNVVADKVGTYEATINLKNKEYPFTVEVVDTTAPDGTFADYFTAKNSAVVPDDYGISVKDCSEYKVGFAESELIKTPDEIATLFQETIAVEDGSDSEESEESSEIDFVKMFDLAWDESNDSKEEKGYDSSNLADNFEPEEDGLYKITMVAADVHGNATLMNVYALVDTTAPVISGAEDATIVIDNNTDADTMTTKGVAASDNMMGDITASIIKEEEITQDLDKDINGFKAKVTYTVADVFGNETVVERNMDFSFDKESIVPKPVVPDDGFNRSMAEEAFALVNQQRASAGLHQLAWDEGLYNFACTRAQEIVSKFSHERPDGVWVTDAMESMGYTNGCGENAARYSNSPSAVVNDWMNSSSHKKNIMQGYFTAGAISCYVYNGNLYWVNLFRG